MSSQAALKIDVKQFDVPSLFPATANASPRSESIIKSLKECFELFFQLPTIVRAYRCRHGSGFACKVDVVARLSRFRCICLLATEKITRIFRSKDWTAVTSRLCVGILIASNFQDAETSIIIVPFGTHQQHPNRDVLNYCSSRHSAASLFD